MFMILLAILAFCLLRCHSAHAVVCGSANIPLSSYVRLRGVGMGEVKWTEGFWAERFNRYTSFH